MEDNINMYMYGFRDIFIKWKTRYLLAISDEKVLTPTIPLQLWPSEKEIKDHICSGYNW